MDRSSPGTVRPAVVRRTVRSPHGPATATVAALAVAAAASVAGAILETASYRLTDHAPSPADTDLATRLTLTDSVLTLAAGLFASVAFIVWLSRARTNLDDWGVRGLAWQRAWAIRGWFVPFLNVVVPLIVISDTQRESARLAAVADNRPVDRRGRRTFLLWAVFWNVYGVISLVQLLGPGALAGAAGAGVGRASPGGLSFYAALLFAAAAFAVVSAVFAILLVRGVTADQERVLQAAPAA